jgi:hypothetical protein
LGCFTSEANSKRFAKLFHADLESGMKKNHPGLTEKHHELVNRNEMFFVAQLFMIHDWFIG